MDSPASPTSVGLGKSCGYECSCSSVCSPTVHWLRSVKRKYDEFEEGHKLVIPGVDQPSVARVEIENECAALRETVSSQQQSIQELYEELEEERNAASSAANEAMSMILRLQREKAEIQMEARQFKRFVEEKMAHDQQELLALEDLLYRREQSIQALTCEVQAYRHRMMSFGLTEAEADGQRASLSGSQSMTENMDGQLEFPIQDYPPLKCNMNGSQTPFDDNEGIDIEKYAFGESPRAREQSKNLENRIYQMEATSCSNHLDGEFSGSKNILEKVVVGQSPRQSRHTKKLSTDSSTSFMGFKETGSDFTPGSPRPPSSSSRKAACTSYAENNSNLRKMDSSDYGDDMTDRVYTIDSIHKGTPSYSFTESKPAVGICDDYVTTAKQPLNQADVGVTELKKLYTRVQVLEAERESMRQAIISMQTDKAQIVLLREIAQHLCKEMTPERQMSIKKASVVGSFSFMSIFKVILDTIVDDQFNFRISSCPFCCERISLVVYMILYFLVSMFDIFIHFICENFWHHTAALYLRPFVLLFNQTTVNGDIDFTNYFHG